MRHSDSNWECRDLQTILKRVTAESEQNGLNKQKTFTKTNLRWFLDNRIQVRSYNWIERVSEFKY